MFAVNVIQCFVKMFLVQILKVEHGTSYGWDFVSEKNIKNEILLNIFQMFISIFENHAATGFVKQ